jgi:diacylglycerol O-acyltransferase / trehalose O-mycolyltransferase
MPGKFWRVLVLTVLVLAVVGCDGGARRLPVARSTERVSGLQVVATTVVSARMRDLTVASPALGATAMVRLLLPEHYATRPERRWPVLFLLHGCCDTYQSWTRSTDVGQLTARSDVLVVMPDGGRAGFYSDWLVGPRWETFHLVELPRILQRDYRASTVMAIAGVSMGGLGALDYAARHRGMFRAAASFSGIVDTRLTQRESQRYVGLVHSQGADPSGLWGDPRDHAVVWAEHNPYDLASHLRGIPLHLAVGTGKPGPLDPPGTAPSTIESALAAENQALAARLRALNIPAQYDFYGPGTHNWPYWQRDLHRAWPLLQTALGGN